MKLYRGDWRAAAIFLHSSAAFLSQSSSCGLRVNITSVRGKQREADSVISAGFGTSTARLNPTDNHSIEITALLRGTSLCFVLSRNGTHAVFSTGVFHFHFEGKGLFLGAGSSGLAPSLDGGGGHDVSEMARRVWIFQRNRTRRWDLDLRWRSRFSWYTHTHTHIEHTQAPAVFKLSLPHIHTHIDFIIDNMLKKTPDTGLTAFPISQTAVTLTSPTKRSRMLGPRCNTLSRKPDWCWCVYVCVVIAVGIFSQDGLSQFPLVA